MSLFWAVVLLFLLMALVFFLAIKAAYRSHSPLRPLFIYPLIFSFIMTSGYMAWGYHAICTSKSSTAAIGFLFFPLNSVVVAVAGFLFWFSGLYVARFVAERLGLISERITSVFPLVLAIVLLILMEYVICV
ncbi:MAG: hypothetical protein JXM70_05050 [Pirellulales bacterium]|nr:hypothetical protein [Pirellulales bacterium]